MRFSVYTVQWIRLAYWANGSRTFKAAPLRLRGCSVCICPPSHLVLMEKERVEGREAERVFKDCCTMRLCSSGIRPRLTKSQYRSASNKVLLLDAGFADFAGHFIRRHPGR